MPQFPSLPETAHLTDLLVRFPHNVRPLMDYTTGVLRREGALPVAARELLAAYVSGLNACTFCLGAHEIYARALGIAPGLVAALLDDPDSAPVDDALRPILAYARKLNTLPPRLTPADAQAVFDAGWSEQALFEAIEVVGLFNLMNRMIEGAGVNFDYGADESQHTVSTGDPAALADSYTVYADRIAALAAGRARG